jgi:5'-3' exonuclease
MTYLIDASIYIFRAWFSIPDSMTDTDNNPVNAVYGYARFLSEFVESVQPEFVAAAFDESLTTSFRTEIYPEYKANREPAPPELKRQFEQCRRVTRALGIMDCADGQFEADDLIGTMAAGMRDAGHCITIVSRDKDLVQILQNGDSIWDYAGNKTTRYDQVQNTFGVRPEQMVDFLGLAGDSVDNIPGVPGVGQKTATALLDAFDSIDDIYANLDRVADLPVRGAGKLGPKLAEHKNKVALSRELAQIRYDAPVESNEVSLARKAPDLEDLNSFYDGLGFGEALRRQAQRIWESY